MEVFTLLAIFILLANGTFAATPLFYGCLKAHAHTLEVGLYYLF